MRIYGRGRGGLDAVVTPSVFLALLSENVIRFLLTKEREGC
ncbi:hypothetical protein B23_3456 [Geobacillus thermoleovorans B23]|nr:hypothetical protein B23_3456 [Geobacillus thermoleovorans B23]